MGDKISCMRNKHVHKLSLLVYKKEPIKYAGPLDFTDESYPIWYFLHRYMRKVFMFLQMCNECGMIMCYVILKPKN